MRQGSAKGDLPDKGKVILRCSGLVRPTMAMATGSLQIKARWSPTCRFSRPESGRVGAGSWRRLASEEQPDPINNRIQYASSDGPGGTDLESREQRGGTWALLQILLSSLLVDRRSVRAVSTGYWPVARSPTAHGPPLTTGAQPRQAHSLGWQVWQQQNAEPRREAGGVSVSTVSTPCCRVSDVSAVLLSTLYWLLATGPIDPPRARAKHEAAMGAIQWRYPGQ
jgi:hypothetical protein